MLFALCAASLPMPAAIAGNNVVPPGRTSVTGSRRAELVDLHVSAFPLVGNPVIPGTTEPFFQTDEGGRFHLAPRGGKLYEHPTYDDPRTLLVLPPAKAKPQALVVFFHGNLATLEHDVVGRQRVVAQFERSGLNAALVAPQLAVNALDSSPGRFYEQGFLDDYLAAAGVALAERSQGRLTAAELDALPVIFVAYSGGYLATAYSLPAQSRTQRRILGVVLLDALFGEEPKFADWLRERPDAFFVSAYSASSAALNGKLADELGRSGVTVLRTLPGRLKPGDVVLQAALTAVHNDFVTAAWTRDPLAAVLKRVDLGPER
ncbi:hypothetical protein RHAL1_01266 [Beijerinckiaceae bacterium RH AL1]|nr:alpha/beta hydrolase [Beijerinckiaceae bacterium]VVB44468.1 hypothetical protein RHCH11_RHCH11_01240 [Beijerinckiaceae bacterium RH CH11]VVB44548.1 hypothetical protein RHAL8_01237 [Beijerinckiaceae bacterium RH AL8]VVC54369.1 hypothetical protein RHAL1_01266 [Beijerinckiaceae bacterium RH AL1]